MHVNELNTQKKQSVELKMKREKIELTNVLIIEHKKIKLCEIQKDGL